MRLFEITNSQPIPETGKPITFNFMRNLEKAPNFGTLYAQDIEPSGEYMNYYDPSWGVVNNKNLIYGIITFNNPLVLPHITTAHGGWKTTLTNMFGGLVGKRLSRAVLKKGYDGIITVDDTGEITEVVNLSGEKRSIEN